MDPSPTRATVLIDGAPVTILPRRAPVGNSGPIRGRPLAIFPAEPPTLPELPDVRLVATIEPGDQPGFAIQDLDHVNRCAYFDYQREKVYLRTSKAVKRACLRHRKFSWWSEPKES